MRRDDRGGSAVKHKAPCKKPNGTKRKTVKRQATFDSSPWYQKAALAISAARSRD